MHIAFLSSDQLGGGTSDRDIALVRAFETLGIKVTVIVPERPPAGWHERWRGSLARRTGYNAFTSCDVSRLRRLARSIEATLHGTKADIVLSMSTHYSAWLETPLPVVNWLDAVFDCIVDFYPSHMNLDYLSRRAGHRAEKRALRRSSLTLLMSFWAAGRAIRCYDVPESQVGVVQAPAVFSHEPSRSEVLARRSGERRPLTCLIMGSDWLRKGADIAVESVRKARSMGADVRLTTVGMQTPPELKPESWLDVLPQLRKSRPDEYARLCQSFLGSDVFFFPSRADFSPRVMSEAYAYGLPVIGSPVGGIPDMIEHGQTGFVARRTDDAGEYAGLLYRLAMEPSLLAHMAVESRNKYEAEYAQSVVSRKLAAHLESVLYRVGGSGA